MIDTDCMDGVMDTMSVIDHTRRPSAHNSDAFGNVHLLLFGFRDGQAAEPASLPCLIHSLFVCALPGDFKQLPPATSKAPFIVIPALHEFDFRCLHQNRRVVSNESRKEELDEFHEVLTDISLGLDTNPVRKFVIDSYVRGADYSAESCSCEGNTAVFTKRRYR